MVGYFYFLGGEGGEGLLFYGGKRGQILKGWVKQNFHASLQTFYAVLVLEINLAIYPHVL